MKSVSHSFFLKCLGQTDFRCFAIFNEGNPEHHADKYYFKYSVTRNARPSQFFNETLIKVGGFLTTLTAQLSNFTIFKRFTS